MTIYYVATTGRDSGTGTASDPFRTISKAMSANLRPGDEVVVRPGTYNETVNITKDGSAAGGYITLRSEVPGEALIRPPSGAWNAVSVNADYITVDGFDIRGGNGDGIESNNVHHIRILNNTVHGAGESGIQFNWSEFIHIEGNHTYDNANSSWASGISVYQNRNITGDTTTQGFRTVIKNNISHDNVTHTGAHTDGNGIIIDDFQSTQTSGHPNYTYPTLVENNLVYLNGGKGVQVTWSDYVTVRNNTAWHNNQDLQNSGTWRGELSNSQSSNNTWINNIAVSDPSVNSNNTAIDNTSYGGYKNANVTWYNNITYNGRDGQAAVKTDGGNAMPTAANGNQLGVNPLFTDAPDNFHVKAGSPAINSGSNRTGLASEDLDGGSRAIGTVDIGAYEFESGGGNGGGGGGNSAPTDVTLSATRVLETANAGSVIGRFTAKDADGDDVSFSVADSRFRVTSDDDLVVAANANLAGNGDRTVALTVTATDGKGGTTVKVVNVTIVDVPSTPVGSVTAANDRATVNEDSSVLISVLGNDGAGATLAAVGTGGLDAPDHGTVTIVNGQVRYTPDANYFGTDSFGYRVSGPGGSTATATVSVTVNGVNDAPVAVADSGYATKAGTAIRIPVSSLLANDRDVDGDALTINRVWQATNGSVALDGKDVVFTPAAGYTGAAGFTYRITDGNGATSTAQVSLSVTKGAAVSADPVSLWANSARPAIANADDDRAVQVGTRFESSVAGEVTAIRFFKGADNDGTHVGKLWTAGGTQLASVTFTNETASGWQTAKLSNPVDLKAGQDYIVSYHAPGGDYSITHNFFSGSFASGYLTASAGVYNYGGANGFPTQTYKASNYWVDVVFQPDVAKVAGAAAPVTSVPEEEALNLVRGTHDDDVLVGGADGDLLLGRNGDDSLDGRAGDDILVGGRGVDMLRGGKGADTFRFLQEAELRPGAPDVIRDFSAKEGDIIDLKGIDANKGLDGNQAFVFIGDKAFTAAGQLRYADGVVSGNTEGGTHAEFSIEIASAPLLTADAFLL